MANEKNSFYTPKLLCFEGTNAIVFHMLGIVYVVLIVAAAVVVRLGFKKAWIAQFITGAGLLPAAVYFMANRQWLAAALLMIISVSDLRWASRNWAMRF